MARLAPHKRDDCTDLSALRSHVAACGGDTAEFDALVAAMALRAARTVAAAASGDRSARFAVAAWGIDTDD